MSSTFLQSARKHLWLFFLLALVGLSVSNYLDDWANPDPRVGPTIGLAGAVALLLAHIADRYSTAKSWRWSLNALAVVLFGVAIWIRARGAA